MEIWRQNQMLMCEGGLQPLCTDFWPDCTIQIFTFAGFVKTGIISLLKQDQNKYKCRAGHTSFLHPTTKKKNWPCDNISARKSDETNSDSNKVLEISSTAIPELSSVQIQQRSSQFCESSTIASVATT